MGKPITPGPFDRAEVERLIARVESGLAYDELAPYARALRECLIAIDACDAVEAASQRTIASGNEASRVMREKWHADRDQLRAEVASLTAERDSARATTTIVGAQFGPRDREMRRAIAVLGMTGNPTAPQIGDEIERVVKERDAMGHVVTAAESLCADTSDERTHLDVLLRRTVEVYRASKERT